jgi:hypothetical protein
MMIFVAGLFGGLFIAAIFLSLMFVIVYFAKKDALTTFSSTTAARSPIMRVAAAPVS